MADTSPCECSCRRFTDVGALPGFSNEPSSIGWAINNNGTIAGASNGGVWIADSTGDMWRLRRQAAYTAYGINDAGDVVGMLAPSNLGRVLSVPQSA